MVAYDRLVRREIRSRWVRAENLDPSRPAYLQGREEKFLYAPANKSIKPQINRKASYKGFLGREIWYTLPPLYNRPGNRLFSNRTRNYLRRRVWRYFRFLSYRDPEAYLDAMAYGLSRYRDGDFVNGREYS